MTVNFNNNQDMLADLYDAAEEVFNDDTSDANREEPDCLIWSAFERAMEMTRLQHRSDGAEMLVDLHLSTQPN